MIRKNSRNSYNILRFFNKKNSFGMTISGGGVKAFFALGVGHTLRKNGIKVDVYSGTSAGSAVVLSLLLQNEDLVVKNFMKRVSRNSKNFDLKNIILGKRLFPHEKITREIIEDHIDVEVIRKSKSKIFLNALKFPREIYDKQEAMRRFIVYSRIFKTGLKELYDFKKGLVNPRMHEVALQFDLKERVFTNADFKDAETGEQILLNTSSFPPFVAMQKFENEYYLDGGIYDNLPIRLLPETETIFAIHYDPLVRLVTEKLGRCDNRKIMWITPSSKLPLAIWDYTSPEGVHFLYEHGKLAAENTLRAMEKKVRPQLESAV